MVGYCSLAEHWVYIARALITEISSSPVPITVCGSLDGSVFLRGAEV
jgi:hypothetical protein